MPRPHAHMPWHSVGTTASMGTSSVATDHLRPSIRSAGIAPGRRSGPPRGYTPRCASATMCCLAARPQSARKRPKAPPLVADAADEPGTGARAALLCCSDERPGARAVRNRQPACCCALPGRANPTWSGFSASYPRSACHPHARTSATPRLLHWPGKCTPRRSVAWHLAQKSPATAASGAPQPALGPCNGWQERCGATSCRCGAGHARGRGPGACRVMDGEAGDPLDAASGTRVTSIACGSSHSLALLGAPAAPARPDVRLP